MESGIYFGLPESDYHAAEALSNTGIKWMLASPMDFWARTPWLNPAAEQEDDREALVIGSAYDCRITEGSERFYHLYAAALDPSDYPDAIRTMDELRAALKDAGEKTGGTKADLIGRLLAINPDAEIWDDLLAEHAKRHEGKTMLSTQTIHRIEIAAAMIEKHPDLGRCFTGGYPQVSIFWIDEEYGVPMKARLDYLKPRATVDLKTFANLHGKPIDRAVATAMASYKYHIQVAVYQEAVERARAMLKDGDLSCVHGDVDGGWLDKFIRANDHRFVFVFQQKGVAPVARGYEFTRSLTFDCGRVQANHAKQLYRECLDRYGADPWIDGAPIRAFDDSEFPVYMME